MVTVLLLVTPYRAERLENYCHDRPILGRDADAAGGGVNLRVPLVGVDDLDGEAADLLRRAYTANL